MSADYQPRHLAEYDRGKDGPIYAAPRHRGPQRSDSVVAFGEMLRSVTVDNPFKGRA